MNKMFFECGDKIISVEEVGVIKDEEPFTENIRKYQSIEECGDKHKDDHAFFSQKQCEACARKSYEFDNIDTNNETVYSNNLSSRLDAEELAEVTCRRAEYKSIIDSLRLDLNNGRNKLQVYHHEMSKFQNETYEDETTKSSLADLSYPTNFFTTTVDSKLCSDNDLKEYEKQLQSYQKTLNVAQNVKKNAIRKQMLAKAFKLKLLEVENQCNIELLRIKQNLQCLEPLKMIAESWKTEKHNIDLSKYDLSPLFPDILLNTAIDTISSKESQEKEST